MSSRRKNPKKINALQVLQSVRKRWAINPATRVVQSRRDYRRPRAKQETRQDLQSKETYE